MAGIVFTDVANSLLPLIQMDRQSARDDENQRWQRQKFDEERIYRDKVRADEQAYRDSVRKDEQDFRRQTLNEARADRQAALDLTRQKEQAEWTAYASDAILSAPPEGRAAMYDAMMKDGTSRGYKLSHLPSTYSPQMDTQLDFWRRGAKEIVSRLSSAPQAMPAPGMPGQGAPGPGGLNLPAAQAATAKLEGDYGSVGNPTNNAGNRAYGKYQVMDFNIGPWTKEVLGREWTPQEFIAKTPEANAAQDAVFNAKFGQLAAKYGPEGAARAWFAGEGGMNNPNAKDVNGMTVANYGRKWAGAYQAQNPEAPTDSYNPGGFLPTNMPAQAPGGLPQMPPGGPTEGPGGAVPPGMELDMLRRQFRNNGGDIFTVKGLPEIQDGHYVVRSLQNPQIVVGMVPVKPKEPKEPGSMQERDRATVLKGDPSTAEYAAAYAELAAERIVPDANSPGGFTRIKPDMSWARPPTFSGYGQGAPAPGTKSVEVNAGKGKPLDNSTRDDLKKAADPLLEMTELAKTFDPSFGGYMFDSAGNAANFAKRNLPDWAGGEDAKGQAQWWQRYSAVQNLERNAQFGATLTAGELQAWKESAISPGMKPEQIKANLDRRVAIAQKALSRLANSVVSSGYNKDAVESLIGTKVDELPSPQGGVPQATAPRVRKFNSETGRIE